MDEQSKGLPVLESHGEGDPVAARAFASAPVVRWLNQHRDIALVVALFVAFRLMWLMAYPADSVTQYGDYPYYHGLAQLVKQGRLPFLGYWVEYPPLFAYLCQGIYALTGDRYQAFATLLGLVMMAFEAGNVVMVYRLAGHVRSREDTLRLAWVYALLFAPAFVMWHNHDVISTFFLLLAADEFLRRQSNAQRSGAFYRSAVWAGVGAMVKYFPLLLLPVIWRFRPSARQAIAYTAIVVGVCTVVIAPFLIASPTYAVASLRAQTAKTSWQTVWALVDGNLGTGIFGPVEAHTDPVMAVASQGHPARIPPVVPLVAFGALYAWLWTRATERRLPGVTPTSRPSGVPPFGHPTSNLQPSPTSNLRPPTSDLLPLGPPALRASNLPPFGRPTSSLQFLAFTAMTLIVFFLWSKGWSPQWLAMLIPFALIVLPLGRALLYILTLSFINLAEWPVFLSRGMNQWLYLTAPLRTILFVLLLIELVQVISARDRTA